MMVVIRTVSWGFASNEVSKEHSVTSASIRVVVTIRSCHEVNIILTEIGQGIVLGQ